MPDKVLLTSVPKCGTHLLLRYFPLVGFRRGGPSDEIRWDDSFLNFVRHLEAGYFSSWHYQWSQALSDIVSDNGIKVVFLYRDPRAHLASYMHFILETNDHPWHDYLAGCLRTPAERMRNLIEGFSYDKLPLVQPKGSPKLPLSSKDPAVRARKFGGVRERYLRFENWLREASCFRVRFEDVVGPKGGGSAERQIGVVRRLMAFTGVCNGAADPRDVADALFDTNTVTFRKGRIDSWRDDFTPELRELFLREFGDKLALWGYEP